jgi:hypothetical protein
MRLIAIFILFSFHVNIQNIAKPILSSEYFKKNKRYSNAIEILKEGKKEHFYSNSNKGFIVG